MRDITTETTKVTTGKGPAASSYKADSFNLISPRLLRRLARRLTVGGDKYGSVQWRQGINDADYVTDRFNHFFDHLLKFMEDGDTKDDNLGAMIWGLHALVEVEELAPEALNKVIGGCKLFGESATKVHEEEMTARSPVISGFAGAADTPEQERPLSTGIIKDPIRVGPVAHIDFGDLKKQEAPATNPYIGGGGLLGLFRRN